MAEAVEAGTALQDTITEGVSPERAFSLALGALGPQGEKARDEHEYCHVRAYPRFREASDCLVTF